MKNIDQKTLWQGKFIKTILISYKDHKGVVREWEAVGRMNEDGVVVIIPVTDNVELIIIRQFRPALNSYVIELPAGLVDPGEDYISAAKRELLEETGYSSDNMSLLTEGVISTGINAEKWKIVIAQNVVRATEEAMKMCRPDENENIEVIKMPAAGMYEALQEYSRNGDDVDLRIFGLWELAKRKLNLL